MQFGGESGAHLWVRGEPSERQHALRPQTVHHIHGFTGQRSFMRAVVPVRRDFRRGGGGAPIDAQVAGSASETRLINSRVRVEGTRTLFEIAERPGSAKVVLPPESKARKGGGVDLFIRRFSFIMGNVIIKESLTRSHKPALTHDKYRRRPTQRPRAACCDVIQCSSNLEECASM